MGERHFWHFIVDGEEREGDGEGKRRRLRRLW